MVKQPAHCKYTPLETYFRSLPTAQTELVLSFNQIEKAMQSPLPRSAYERMSWWNNAVNTHLSHKNAWLHAGWNVKSADLVERTVQFVRVR